MMSFIGKIGPDTATLQKNAESVAIAALRATGLPQVERLGDVLAAHVAAHGLDVKTLAFIYRLIEPMGGPRVGRAASALLHAGNALYVAQNFDMHMTDDFGPADLGHFDDGVSNVYQAARLVAQIESLAKHQPPAGSRGSRKGHG